MNKKYCFPRNSILPIINFTEEELLWVYNQDKSFVVEGRLQSDRFLESMPDEDAALDAILD